jgi:hypothetical protein
MTSTEVFTADNVISFLLIAVLLVSIGLDLFKISRR